MTFDGPIKSIRRFYRRPMRRGAMMIWQEARTTYCYLLLSIFFAGLFSISLVAAEPGRVTAFWGFIGWSLVGGSIFSITIFCAVIYGYHHRDEIDPGDETQVDLSKAVWGGIFAAVLVPIIRWLIDYFGG